MFVERSWVESYTNEDPPFYFRSYSPPFSMLLCAMTCMACIMGSRAIWLQLILANNDSWRLVRGRENSDVECYSPASSL